MALKTYSLQRGKLYHNSTSTFKKSYNDDDTYNDDKNYKIGNGINNYIDDSNNQKTPNTNNKTVGICKYTISKNTLNNKMSTNCENLNNLNTKNNKKSLKNVNNNPKTNNSSLQDMSTLHNTNLLTSNTSLFALKSLILIPSLSSSIALLSTSSLTLTSLSTTLYSKPIFTSLSVSLSVTPTSLSSSLSLSVGSPLSVLSSESYFSSSSSSSSSSFSSFSFSSFSFSSSSSSLSTSSSFSTSLSFSKCPKSCLVSILSSASSSSLPSASSSVSCSSPQNSKQLELYLTSSSFLLLSLSSKSSLSSLPTQSSPLPSLSLTQTFSKLPTPPASSPKPTSSQQASLTLPPTLQTTSHTLLVTSTLQTIHTSSQLTTLHNSLPHCIYYDSSFIQPLSSAHSTLKPAVAVFNTQVSSTEIPSEDYKNDCRNADDSLNEDIAHNIIYAALSCISSSSPSPTLSSSSFSTLSLSPPQSLASSSLSSSSSQSILHIRSFSLPSSSSSTSNIRLRKKVSFDLTSLEALKMKKNKTKNKRNNDKYNDQDPNNNELNNNNDFNKNLNKHVFKMKSNCFGSIADIKRDINIQQNNNIENNKNTKNNSENNHNRKSHNGIIKLNEKDDRSEILTLNGIEKNIVEKKRINNIGKNVEKDMLYNVEKYKVPIICSNVEQFKNINSRLLIEIQMQIERDENKSGDLTANFIEDNLQRDKKIDNIRNVNNGINAANNNNQYKKNNNEKTYGYKNEVVMPGNLGPFENISKQDDDWNLELKKCLNNSQLTTEQIQPTSKTQQTTETTQPTTKTRKTTTLTQQTTVTTKDHNELTDVQQIYMNSTQQFNKPSQHSNSILFHDHQHLTSKPPQKKLFKTPNISQQSPQNPPCFYHLQHSNHILQSHRHMKSNSESNISFRPSDMLSENSTNISSGLNQVPAKPLNLSNDSSNTTQNTGLSKRAGYSWVKGHRRKASLGTKDFANEFPNLLYDNLQFKHLKVVT